MIITEEFGEPVRVGNTVIIMRPKGSSRISLEIFGNATNVPVWRSSVLWERLEALGWVRDEDFEDRWGKKTELGYMSLTAYDALQFEKVL